MRMVNFQLEIIGSVLIFSIKVYSVLAWYPTSRVHTRETGEYKRFVLRRLILRLRGTACVHNIAVFGAKLVLVIFIPTHHIHLADILGYSPFNFLS